VSSEDSATAANQASLAQAAIDHGNTLMWKQLRDDAADAYALAATWSPDEVDYVQLRTIFEAPDRETGAPGPESARGKQTEIRTFNRVCEGGAKGFVEVFGAEDPRGLALFWWLGYSRLELGNFAGAEEAFLVTLDKDPEANSWFYLAMSRYLRQENERAISALARGWETDPAAILTEMKLDAENHIARLEVLTGWAFAEGRLMDCALLSEICAETALKDARHWHNLGIFLRDELGRIDEESDPVEEEQLTELRQRALNAHMRALTLSPDDPQILNDTAVIMHYHQEEDLPVALKMYEHAIDVATKRLEEEDLSEAERARIGAARDDAMENREILSRRLDG
jgi:tetratricopeptide (TPR) repeat protein